MSKRQKQLSDLPGFTQTMLDSTLSAYFLCHQLTMSTHQKREVRRCFIKLMFVKSTTWKFFACFKKQTIKFYKDICSKSKMIPNRKLELSF